MHQMKRRRAYQYGTLALETRKRGPDVWIYRHFDFADGGKQRRKTIVGTFEQYPNRVAAERACQHLRLAANAETLAPECPMIRGLSTGISSRCFARVSIFLLEANRTARLEFPSTVRSRTDRCSTSGSDPAGRATGCAISTTLQCELPSRNGSVRCGGRRRTPGGLRRKPFAPSTT
jgi:hypothetical protein